MTTDSPAARDQPGRPIGEAVSPSGSHGALINLGGNVAIGAANVVTGLLAARILGATGRGQLATIQLWPTLLASLAVLGFPEALTYFAARDRRRAGQYLVSAMLLSVPAGLVAIAAGYFLLPLIIGEGNRSLVTDARIYLLIIPIFILVGLPYHPLRGTGDFAKWNLLRVAPTLIWLLLLIGFLFSSHVHPGAVADSFLVGQGVLILPVALIVRRALGPPFSPARSTFRPLLAFGLPAMLTTLPQALNLRLDQLLMVSFVPSHQLGLYVVAVSWSMAIVPVVYAIGLVVLPRIAAVEDPYERREFLAKSSRLSLMIGALIGLAIGLLTPAALPIVFGSSFSGAVATAVILIPAAVVLGWNYVVAEGIRGLGRPRTPLYAEGIGLGVTAVGLALLLPSLGIVGAAVVSVLSYGTVGGYQIWRLQKMVDCPLRYLLQPTYADVRLVVSQVRFNVSRLTASGGIGSRNKH